MTRYVVSLPDYTERVRKSMAMTPAQRVAQIESDPKAMSILRANQLTGRDYVVGVAALRMAIMVASGMPPGGKVVASPANVAFAKANLSTLKPQLDAVDRGTAPRK
jgi:hypothetical protein